MGRNWYLRASSNIESNGQFWCAIQESDDFKFLGFEESEGQQMFWKVCRCCFQSDDRPDEDYCVDCYDSYEEHLEAVQEDEGDDEECVQLWEPSKLVNYRATKNDIYPRLQGLIKGFESAGVDKWFDSITISHSNPEIDHIEIDHDYDWESKSDILSEGQLEVMAKYYLCLICKYVFDLGAKSISVDCEF